MDNVHGTTFSTDRASQLTDAEVLLEARNLVEQYVDYLHDNPIGNDIVDVSDLPCPRDTLVTCFRLMIATEYRQEVREHLMSAGLTLSQFQEDIGERMSLEPIEPENAATLEQLRALTLRYRHYLEKFDVAYRAIAPERARLEALYRHAMAMACAKQTTAAQSRANTTSNTVYH
jgi:hypothetical protein